ncbi:MAG: MFS transporter [Firmicutes bacterium]|nr:MFS transporter [Bacillota bacterium]
MSNKLNSKKFKEYAWKMLLSFGFIYLFFYNGRQNINLVMTQMAEDFGSTTTTIGIISSSLFWCYAFGQLINGRLGAYFGHKKFMIVGIIMSTIMNILISFQNSIIVIAIFWGLNGYFQSMVWSNGLGVLNKWWTKDKRGFATGIATAFSGLAQVITYLSVSLCIEIAPELGWRAGFRFPIIPILFLLIPFSFLFKEKPEDVGLKPLNQTHKKNKKSENFFYPYKKLFRNPKMILFCVISAIAGIGRYGLLTWIPTYFMESMGLSIKEGIFSSILLPIGQAFAMFIFPFLTDKVFKGKREPMLALASILTFISMIAFPFIHSQSIASLILLVVGIFSMITGVIWSVAGDIGGTEYSSTAAGILDWSVYMGAAIQAFMFGFIKDTFGWSAIFITIGCLYIVILILTNMSSKLKEE